MLVKEEGQWMVQLSSTQHSDADVDVDGGWGLRHLVTWAMYIM